MSPLQTSCCRCVLSCLRWRQRLLVFSSMAKPLTAGWPSGLASRHRRSAGLTQANGSWGLLPFGSHRRCQQQAVVTRQRIPQQAADLAKRFDPAARYLAPLHEAIAASRWIVQRIGGVGSSPGFAKAHHAMSLFELETHRRLSFVLASGTIRGKRLRRGVSCWRSNGMGRSRRCRGQRSLLFDDGPGWWCWSEEQRRRLVELWAELLVAHLDCLRLVGREAAPDKASEPKEDVDD